MARRHESHADGAKSFFDVAAKFVAIGLRCCVNLRKIDQLMACLSQIHAERSHYFMDGGFIFTECKQVSAEITKNEARFFDLFTGAIILADLPRTDRQFPRFRHRDALKGKQPLEDHTSEANYFSYRLADQFNGDFCQEGDSRNRNQVDIPLHAAPQPGLRAAICGLGSINLNSPLPTRPNR